MNKPWHRLGILCAAAVLAAAPGWAQEVIIDEDFSTDPAGMWTFNGRGANPYWDAVRQRVVVTDAANDRAGSIIYNELIDVNNFRLEATARLCCGTGADGMAITLFESWGDPGDFNLIGAGGGGMGVAGLTTGAQIIIEFDIWGNGAGCEACPDDTRGGAAANHIGVQYNPDGFGFNDCLPADGGFNSACASDATMGFTMYGASPGYDFELVVQVQDAIVTVDIGSEDLGVGMRRVITKTFVSYSPFTGLLAFTASTGGANAEQSISSIKLTTLDKCIIPPATVTRGITPSTTTDLEWDTIGAYELGVPVPVGLTIGDLRVAAGICTVPAGLIVEDVLPAGWTAQSISHGGTFAGGRVTWNVAAPANGQQLTYQAVPGGQYRVVDFAGTFRETDVADPDTFASEGDFRIFPVESSGFYTNGFISKWLFLGPLLQRADIVTAGLGANPGADVMALDYLTDGDITEFSILPRAGDEISPDYNGASASSGLAAITATNSRANPGGIPAWVAWLDANDTISFDDGDAANDLTSTWELYGTVDQVMAYGFIYVVNETGQAIPCFAGAASDDGVQIILNGASVWVNSVPRGAGAQFAVQDVVPVVLNPGVNRLMVKVFEGGGGFQLRLRFQDGDAQPITEGLTISLEPPTEGCPVPPVEITRELTLKGQILSGGVLTPAYFEESGLEVALSLANVRAAGGGCPAAGNVTIVEYLPAGWTATGITGGGAFDGGRITWTIPAANLAATTALSYTADGPVVSGTMGIAGSVLETGNVLSFAVGGEGAFLTDYAIGPDGFILTWLILGPYMQQPPAAANPPVDVMRLDHLTDGGEIEEATVRPRAGDQVETDYMAAASAGLLWTGQNPGNIPTWIAWRDDNGAVNFQDGNLYGAQDNCMAYAVCYVEVDADRDVIIACGSDDSILILLDDEEVWINSIPRGWGSGAPQDRSPPVTLTAGMRHRLMVKVFEGGGDWNFGVRFEDPGTLAPITSGIKVTLEPMPTCEPFKGFRTITAGDTALIEGVATPVYVEGSAPLGVSIVITGVRRPGEDGCPNMRDVTITETLPAGWTAASISDGGTAINNTVRWVIPAAQVAARTLTYQASGPVTGATVVVTGQYTEVGNPFTFAVEGEGSVPTTAGLMPEGAIVKWLLLGPYQQSVVFVGSVPTADQLRQDFLTDGDVTESTVQPREGDEIVTDFGGAAASLGLAAVLNPNINPDGIPQWYAWQDRDEIINLDSAGIYGGVDFVMTYAVCYLEVDDDVTVTLAVGSDDAVQVLLNGVEIWVNPVLRPVAVRQDLISGVALTRGVHTLMVKTFDADGGFAFSVAILDEFGIDPVVDGIRVTLEPGGVIDDRVRVRVGDANGDGVLNIADAITVLSYLFGAEPKPVIPCMKAADANNDNALNIADAISVLSYLFAGASMTKPDGSILAAGAPALCEAYNRALIPATIGGLPSCAMQCTAK